jgi:hypothetical protein
MKQQDIIVLKEKIWIKNNKKCPVLNKEIPLNKMVLDHAHKLKSEEPSIGKGTVRESLEFRVNGICGKIENAFKRYGLDKEIDLVSFLRNAADYFEKGSYQDEEGNYYIHPSEVQKEKKKKISKSCFSKLMAKMTLLKIKNIPDYPKNAVLTKSLEKLFIKYQIEITYLKN